MSKSKKLLVIIAFLIIFSFLVIGGWFFFKHWLSEKGTDLVSPGNETTPTPEVGIANPASVYCEEQGGKLEIRKNPDGSETGWCLFPDGRECDEWNFFRSKKCE